MKTINQAAVIILLIIAPSLASISEPAGKATTGPNIPLSEKNPRTRGEQRLLDASVSTNYNFVSEAWSGNNQPYRLIRIRVNHLLRAGENVEGLLSNAKKVALRNPNNSEAQFLWAYLAYQAKEVGVKRALKIPDREGQQIALLTAIRQLDGVREALAEVPSPHAYDYSRMRFLVGANTNQAGREIKPLGIRLLHHDPSDYAVESTLVRLLKPGLTAGDMTLGLTLAKDMIHRYPTLLEPHELFAGLYSKYWSNNGFHRADAEKAIAESRSYLALLPVNSPLRQDIVHGIQTIQSLQSFEEQRRSQGINDFPPK